MISIGLIGCGRWGLNHLRVFSSLPSAKIKVCCDQDKAVLQKIRCQYPQVNVTGDYRAVFNDAGVDAVIIATPTVTHYALAMAALKKGKHVFCEKPLSVRQEDAKRLSVCAQKKHLVLMVGYVFLSNNGIIAKWESQEIYSRYWLSLNKGNWTPYDALAKSLMDKGDYRGVVKCFTGLAELHYNQPLTYK